MSERDRVGVGPRPRPADLLAEGPDSAPALDRPDPEFEIVAARPLARAATPTLSLTAKISDASGIEIYTAAISVLLTIEPGRRSYGPDERERLVELFGEPERWQATTESLRWAQVDVLAPSFSVESHLEIRVPCSFDHEIAATKYFAGLDCGIVPLRLHFNGTVFYRGGGERLQVMPLPWDRSARFGLPVSTWREMIERHYPEGAWIRVSDETLKRLGRLKSSPATQPSNVGLLDRDRRGEGDDE